jgi:hypothetical protein
MSMIDMTNPHTRNCVVLVTVISALTIEVKTGMKMSRGVQPVEVLKRDFGFTGRQKKVALRYAVEQMQDLDPNYVPSARTAEALA